MRLLPGVEASTGSLGQGLSIGLGHALAARLDGRPSKVYVLIGDGEADEGQIWEASMAAAKFGLANLTAILDNNLFQQTGPVSRVMPSLMPVVDKWSAFGWAVTEVDGHDISMVYDAFENMKQIIGKPQMIVCHTKKGKGLRVFEQNTVNRKHGEVLSNEEAKQTLAELDALYGSRQGGA